MFRNIALCFFIALSNLLIGICSADTFRHRQTGQTFTGFVTGKRSADKIVVYNSVEKRFTSIQPADYEITRDTNGRRQAIMVVPIRQPEALISMDIANKIAAVLQDAADAGPQLLVVEMDSPGGRGEPMKQIAQTLLGIRYCPTAAFISGGTYGGAYSAAAVIAAACETLYMAPNTSIGAVSPMVGAMTDQQYQQFLDLYSSDTLGAYSAFVMSLSSDNRLRPILRALVDKTITLVEVVDADGKTTFVERENRTPTQTVVRTLTEGRMTTGETIASRQGPMPIRTLTLSAADAHAIGWVAKIVPTIAQIAEDKQLSSATISYVGDVDGMVKRFVAAQRNLNRTLAAIDQLEQQASRLGEQIETVENQLRTSTVQREIGQVRQTPVFSRRNVRIGGYQQYTDQIPPENIYNDRTPLTRRNDLAQRRRTTEIDRVTVQIPAADIDQLYAEYAGILNDLILQYRNAINLARRWDGILPPELSLQTLQANMDSAIVQWEQVTGRSARRIR